MESEAPNPARSVPAKLLKFWRWLPARYFWLLLILCAYFQDRAFPFSHFPMYSSLSKRAVYVYVTDEKDQPLAIHPLFAERAANLSKAFRSNLGKVAKQNGRDRKNATDTDYEEAGRQTLAYLELKGRASKPELTRPAGLKLWYVEITRDENHLVETPRFAGSIRSDEVETLTQSAGPAPDTETEENAD